MSEPSDTHLRAIHLAERIGPSLDWDDKVATIENAFDAALGELTAERDARKEQKETAEAHAELVKHETELLVEEKEKAEATNAAMREALVQTRLAPNSPTSWELCDNALSTDAGHRWISVEEFQEALFLIQFIGTTGAERTDVIQRANNLTARHSHLLKTPKTP